MPAQKRYNWPAMGLTAEEALRLVPSMRLNCGSMPDAVRWEATPQGFSFWAKAFMRGDKRAELALQRMLKQAEKDIGGGYAPPVYNIRAISPTPDHLIRWESFLPTYQGPPPMQFIWAATPQGPAFWYEFFAKPANERDSRVISDLLAAAKRAKRLKGGTDV